MKSAPKEESERKFWSMTKQSGECLEWRGARVGDGYGQLRWDGKRVLAHRLAWQNKNGQIPDGLNVLHRCDNPPCVNPAHLFLGTHQENMRDRDAKGRNKSLFGEPMPMTSFRLPVALMQELFAEARRRHVGISALVRGVLADFVYKSGRSK